VIFFLEASILKVGAKKPFPDQTFPEKNPKRTRAGKETDEKMLVDLF
jgi:hypothetical protein